MNTNLDELDPRYVAARRVLLNALEALAPHGKAVVVAGAQAVYLRTGITDAGITPFTTDGDLALDPGLLGDEPNLEETMRTAGFELWRPTGAHPEPGIWVAKVSADGKEFIVPIDLIVPEGIAPAGGTRGARLGSHGRRAARRVIGLEAALVDHTTCRIVALDPTDVRQFDAEVAGAAALFVAKAHKLHDRVDDGRMGRLSDKDAADVYRLMQHRSATEVATVLHRLSKHDQAGPATRSGIGYLIELFRNARSPGTVMAARALELAVPTEQIAVFSTAYVRELEETLRSLGE